PAERRGDLADPDRRRPTRHQQKAGGTEDEPRDGHEAEREDADGEAGDEGSERRGRGEGPEGQPLVVRTTGEDAVDEHRAAADRRREREAREEGDQRGGREGRPSEQARVEERVGSTQAADDGEERRNHGENGE